MSNLEPVQETAIAPDTRGGNFFECDPDLQALLELYLDEDTHRHLRPHLSRLGELAAGELDECAYLANQYPPELHQRDRLGRDIQSISYHPAYRRLEAAAFGEFGLHAMTNREGVLGLPRRFPAVAKHAFTLLFNETEFGLGCPINVTDSAAHLIEKYGDAVIKERFLPRLLSQDMDELWQGAQFITEQFGGSDVGQIESRAEQDGDAFRIFGEKWFCSNADANVILMLARPEGAAEGTRGLGLFVVPREIAHGQPNAYRILRLKDKLGTRSMASGEILFEGAIGFPLGSLDQGFKQMAEMINLSRLSNGVKSAALMRRAMHDAYCVARHRRVFGERLMDIPLARRSLLKIRLPAEQALSMSLFTADALDRVESNPGSNQDAAVFRIATPVLKYRATRDARRVAGDAMEVRGGSGYIEEWITPRLVRDAHLGSIWEGTGSIVSLDVIDRAIGRSGADAALEARLLELLEPVEQTLPKFAKRLRDGLSQAVGAARELAGQSSRIEARQATSGLYHAATACLLANEGVRIDAHKGDARRLLMAQMVLEHRLFGRGPLDRIEDDLEARRVNCLFEEAPRGIEQISDLL